MTGITLPGNVLLLYPTQVAIVSTTLVARKVPHAMQRESAAFRRRNG